MVELPALTHIINALQRCRQTKNLEHAKQLYAYMHKQKLDIHGVLGNHLVPVLVHCGGLPFAQQVFDQLSHQNEHSWGSLISGYVDCGDSQHALNLYDKMQEDCLQPSSHTFLALLRACTRLKDKERGLQIHVDIIKNGSEADLFLSNSLVDMYGKFGFLVEARQVFDKILARDTVSWNALISGFVEHGFAEEALDCFKKMQNEGLSLVPITFACSLKACGSIAALKTGQRIHAEITKRELETELYVGNSLIDMYSKCGVLADARHVFEALCGRDSVSWNALITGYVDCGFAEEALNCFTRMQGEPLPMVAITFVCSLRACGFTKSLDKGYELHTEATRRGLEKDVRVGTTLVDMYAKFGLLQEACKVFDQLPARNVVSWTALITGYAEDGLADETLKFLEQMQVDNISPDGNTFLCSLKACHSPETTERGQEIHAELVKRGLERELNVGTALVDMYSKCGLLAEAQDLFDQLPVRDAVAWTALITGYTENGMANEAMNCFEQLQLEDMSPDADMCVSTLKACCTIRALEMGQAIHADVSRRGLEMDPYMGNTLVDLYAKCGWLAEACQVFQSLSVRDAVSWNALITGYTESGLSEEALKCFRQMQVENISPVAATITCSLKACGIVAALEKGQQIHDEIIKRGLENDVHSGNTLVDMYIKCGSYNEGQQVFDQLPVRTAVAWTALLAGYAEHGFGKEALDCFEQMQLEKVCPDDHTFVSVLKVCSLIGAFKIGQRIHADITKRDFGGEVYVGNTLVDMYAKCGFLVEAQQVFDKLSVHDIVSWNALIAGYTEQGFGENALVCYKHMLMDCVSPVDVTLTCSLKACGIVGAIEIGQEIHFEIIKRGWETATYVANSLLDMYGKCGSLVEAQDVFDKLPVRDVVAWTALIKGYGENDEGDMAVQCFDHMQEQGVKPNAVTFTCLLAACSHCSLVDRGQEYFNMMIEKYEIEPTMDHSACLVDLLARSGHIYQAERFAGAMHCLFSKEILRTLLTASKVHGDVELGSRCFQQLVQLNEEDAATYLLMADIYTCSGRWDDANRMEEMRKHAGAQKKPAITSIAINKKYYDFTVGDIPSKDIPAILKILNLYSKIEGHVPNLDNVLAAEEKINVY